MDNVPNLIASYKTLTDYVSWQGNEDKDKKLNDWDTFDGGDDDKNPEHTHVEISDPKKPVILFAVCMQNLTSYTEKAHNIRRLCTCQLSILLRRIQQEKSDPTAVLRDL